MYDQFTTITTVDEIINANASKEPQKVESEPECSLLTQCKRNANAMQTQCKRNANAMQTPYKLNANGLVHKHNANA